MTPSANADSPPSPTSVDTDDRDSETDLQPFFLLHKAVPKKPGRKPNESAKTRRRIDLTAESPKSADNSSSQVEVNADHQYQQLRSGAFDHVWSKMELTIKEVLRDINTNVFNEIHQWVCQSFASVRSTAAALTSSELNRPYPLMTDIACSKIFTALVFTKNVEFVDDLLTFKHLNLHLKSQGCHVVNLSSTELSAKSGIGGCFKNLLRQLVMVDPDVADITILASWYSEPENYDSPLVVIIDDMERCNGSVLSDFILLLSEWAIKLPVILVMGVATTIDAPRNLLPASALHHLQPCKFALGSPTERLYAILEALIITQNSGFYIGYKVAVFLKNYFLRQDGTVTSFIRALKIACAKHFVMEPLSYLIKDLLDEDCRDFVTEKCALLPKSMLEYAFGLPSCKGKDTLIPVTGEGLASGLSDIMKLRKNWCSVFLCLYEAAKFQNVQLLDILCEALDPALCGSIPTTGSLISQVVRKIRDLPLKALDKLLETWKKHSAEIAEIRENVDELQSMLSCEEESNMLQPEFSVSSKRLASRSYNNTQRDKAKLSEKAVRLMECMIREHLKPTESAAFHEIICFKHVDILQSGLIGDPRRMIQIDLLKSHNPLRHSLTKRGIVLLPSMHDTSVMYTLAQEHGDLINLHDWFQCFKSAIRQPVNAKSKLHSPSPKKRKHANAPEGTIDDVLVQARFCRAVVELQITGLLRMPSKRRPDYVQRVAFGL